MEAVTAFDPARLYKRCVQNIFNLQNCAIFVLLKIEHTHLNMFNNNLDVIICIAFSQHTSQQLVKLLWKVKDSQTLQFITRSFPSTQSALFHPETLCCLHPPLWTWSHFYREAQIESETALITSEWTTSPQSNVVFACVEVGVSHLEKAVFTH